MGKDIFKIVLAIGATGALLNLLGSGKLGTFPKKFAQYITHGFGV